MSIKTKIISLQLPPLGKLIDTLEEQPAEIQEQLRQLRTARAAKVSFHTPDIKALAGEVLRFYVERGLKQAGLDGIVAVELDTPDCNVPNGFVGLMISQPKNFPPEVQSRLQALLDAGAHPDLSWDELSDSAKAAINEHAPFLKEFWAKHIFELQPPSAADDTTSFSA